MKKLLALMRRAPKRTVGVVAALAVAIIAPLTVNAWGPDRPTYTYQNPAPHVTFNSMTGTPNYGDERNFVRIKEATAPNNTYVDEINFQPGKEYTVMVYFHNNAATKYNSVAHDYKGIAVNTKMRVQMPATVKAGEKARITGFVSADNAQPGTVWDEAYGSVSNNVALRYVPNSATIYSNGAVDGQKLPESLYTTGAHLGYDTLDGKLPGCNEYAGFVTFKIKVDQPNFEVTKQVSKKGANNWQDSITANPGEEVDYRIHYKNTGTTVQNNVVIKDTLPAGVTYVAGTTAVSNAASNFQWQATTNNEVTKGGLNIGNYAAGGGAYVKFTAKLPGKDALAKCGNNVLVNKATAETNNGNKSDNADVTVEKKCEPPKPEVKYACKALSVSTIDRTNFRFATSYTAQNATFKSVTYVIKNEAGQTVDTRTSTSTTLNYTQATAGKYTVQATVTFTVDGQDKTATSEACKGSFEVKKEDKKIKVCELATKTIVTINESDFDASKYSKNLADCKEHVKKIKVCELATKQIVTIKESDFDADKYSKNLDDCKETPPAKIEVCDLTTKEIVTIDETAFDETKYSKDLSKCEETPVTPPELPKTGAGESIVAIVGLGALIASAAYYVASRRALNQ